MEQKCRKVGSKHPIEPHFSDTFPVAPNSVSQVCSGRPREPLVLHVLSQYFTHADSAAGYCVVREGRYMQTKQVPYPIFWAVGLCAMAVATQEKRF